MLIKNTKKIMAMMATVGSMLICNSYAYADFDYAEHNYKTYNNTKEDISGKDAYLSKQPEFANSIPANDYILELEEITAKANGLKIGNYAKAGDYKRIVQPARIKIDDESSYNFGNYQIILGSRGLREHSGYEYGKRQNRTPQMDAGIIWEIGHEIGHGVLNHGTGKVQQRIEAQEKDADRIAWYTLEKTSDYGWGYAFTVDLAFRTDNCNENYIKKQTDNKLWISGSNPSNVQYMLNLNGKWQDARDLYDILISNNYQFKHTTSIYDDYAVALGQLGYIYSKEKKIDVNKLAIVPETKYPYLKSKLIYESSNMPNGYKTIVHFCSDADTASAAWNKGSYTSNHGYHPNDALQNIEELKAMKESTLAADTAAIIAVKYAGINIFNGFNYFY